MAPDVRRLYITVHILIVHGDHSRTNKTVGANGYTTGNMAAGLDTDIVSDTYTTADIAMGTDRAIVTDLHIHLDQRKGTNTSSFTDLDIVLYFGQLWVIEANIFESTPKTPSCK